MLKRRLLLAVGIAGFVALVGGVVYLAVSSSPSRSVTPPAAPGLGFQPLPTPPGPARAAPRIGAQAPPFEARRLDAGTLALADLRGQGVVMNFFASWCVPCRAEARDLEATYQKYKAQGIVFLGVDIEQDTWDDARAFIKEFGITYPAIRDETGKIAQRYQMFGLPTTYFIDNDGILRSKYVGPFLGPEGLKELERRIKTILP
ncbi:MAG: TlpA family protein disulfide reductase [Armatimonadetes bacterium]|nr:TlpA family protein disulfide reductase [Armatimonadota bacterium]